MSRPVIAFLGVVLLIACANAQPFQSKNEADHDTFAVSSVGDSAVLIDTQTGQSWMLEHPVSDCMPSVWVPMKRLDSKEDVLRWRAEQAEQAAIQDDTVR